MKPISENIGNTSREIQAKSYLDGWLYRSGKAALEEYTLATSMSIPLNKIIFG
jgi:hypothetical protein